MHASDSLIDKLDDEYKAMFCLLELIKDEQKCLIEANIEDLNKIIDKKTNIIGQITELAEVRHHALEAAGLTPVDESMQTWLEMTSNVTATGKWSKIRAIAQEAKEINRTNGLLINQHLSRNRNALNILQGTSDGGNFYGPNGQSTRTPVPRRLVIG